MFLFFLWNFVFSHRVCRGYSECETYDTNDLLIQALKQLDCDVVQRDIRVTLNQNITLSIADMPKCAYHKFLSESEPSNIIIIGSPSSSSDSLALTLDLEKADSSRFNYAQIDAEYSGDFYLAFKGTSWNLTSLKVDKKVNLLPGSAQNVNLHVIDADIHHNFLQAFKTVNFVQLTVSNSKSDRSITYPNFVQRLQYPEANYLKFDVIENFTVSFNYNKMTMATSDSKKTIDFTLPTYNYTFGFSFDLSEKLYCTFQGDLNYTYPLGGRFFVQHQNDVITFKSGNYLDPDFSYSAGYNEIIHWETNLPVSSLSITNNALLYHDSELINASSFSYSSTKNVATKLTVLCERLSVYENIKTDGGKTINITTNRISLNDDAIIDGTIYYTGREFTIGRYKLQVKFIYFTKFVIISFNFPTATDDNGQRYIVSNSSLLIAEQVFGTGSIYVDSFINYNSYVKDGKTRQAMGRTYDLIRTNFNIDATFNLTFENETYEDECYHHGFTLQNNIWDLQNSSNVLSLKQGVSLQPPSLEFKTNSKDPISTGYSKFTKVITIEGVTNSTVDLYFIDHNICDLNFYVHPNTVLTVKAPQSALDYVFNSVSFIGSGTIKFEGAQIYNQSSINVNSDLTIDKTNLQFGNNSVLSLDTLEALNTLGNTLIQPLKRIEVNSERINSFSFTENGWHVVTSKEINQNQDQYYYNYTVNGIDYQNIFYHLNSYSSTNVVFSMTSSFKPLYMLLSGGTFSFPAINDINKSPFYKTGSSDITLYLSSQTFPIHTNRTLYESLLLSPNLRGEFIFGRVVDSKDQPIFKEKEIRFNEPFTLPNCEFNQVKSSVENYQYYFESVVFTQDVETEDIRFGYIFVDRKEITLTPRFSGKLNITAQANIDFSVPNFTFTGEMLNINNNRNVTAEYHATNPFSPPMVVLYLPESANFIHYQLVDNKDFRYLDEETYDIQEIIDETGEEDPSLFDFLKDQFLDREFPILTGSSVFTTEALLNKLNIVDDKLSFSSKDVKASFEQFTCELPNCNPIYFRNYMDKVTSSGVRRSEAIGYKVVGLRVTKFSKTSGLSVGAIVGIVIACVVAVGGIVGVSVFCCCKRKKKIAGSN